MATTNKCVKLYVPAGVSLNYYVPQGTTLETVLPTTLIKKALVRGCTVEEIKADGTTVPLTEENFESDNGGKEVPEDATVVTDLEEIDRLEAKEADDEYLAYIGELYKKYYEELASEGEEGGGEEEDPSGSESEGEDDEEQEPSASSAPIITSEVADGEASSATTASKFVLK